MDVHMIASSRLAFWGVLVLGTVASAQLTVYEDPDGDGVFEKTRAYSVSYEEAMTAFAEAGGVPWDGTEQILNSVAGPDARLPEPQSWDGFIGFLDQNFQARQPSATQLCDENIDITDVSWQCDAEIDCITPCETSTPTDVNVSFNCNGNVVECPAEKSSCIKTGDVIPLEAIMLPAGEHFCYCPGGPNGDCLKNPIPPGKIMIDVFNQCECVDNTAVPTVSEWGLIVLTLLLLTAGTIVFGRRRKPAVA